MIPEVRQHQTRNRIYCRRQKIVVYELHVGALNDKDDNTPGKFVAVSAVPRPHPPAA